MGLTGGHSGCACVPPETGDGSILGSVVLEAVCHGGHLALAGVLGRLDLPLPGGRRGPRVDVDLDLVALVRGWHEHVLPGVVAADDWGGGVARVEHLLHEYMKQEIHISKRSHCKQFVNPNTKLNIHLKGVSFAFSGLSTIDQDCSGGCGEWVSKHHRVKVDPDFANVAARLADCVCAWVRVRAGRDLNFKSSFQNAIRGVEVGKGKKLWWNGN